MNRERLNWLILLVIVTVTLIPFLGECLFNTKGEPREAIVAVSMLENGDWILPRYYGSDIQFKPPFLYWCIAGLSWLFGGHVTEFLSRVPSAIAAIAMVMTGYTLFRRQKDDAVALAMAMITFTTFEVNRAATSCRLDMLVTAFIVTAIYALYRYSELRRARYAWLAIVLMACGSLTKGPVATVLPCLTIGVYRLIRGERFWHAFWRLAVIGVVSLIPLGLWYVAAFQTGGDDFYKLMMEENVGRFTGKMSYESHTNPFYYNFFTVISGMLPYTLLLLFSLFSLKWAKPHLGKGWLARFWGWLKGLEPITLLSLVAVVVIFTFYCFPASKRSVYLLPIYPFLCYFVALYVRWLSRRGARSVRVFGWVFVVLAVFVPIVYFAVRGGFLQGVGGSSLRRSVDALAVSPLSWWQILLMAVSVGVAITAVRMIRKSTPGKAFAVTVGVIITIYWTYAGVYQAPILNSKSDLPMTKAIMHAFPDDQYYYSYGPQLYTMCFYSGDRVRVFGSDDVKEGIVMIEPDDDARFAEEYPDVRLVQVWTTPANGRCGDTRRPLSAYRFSR